MQLRDGGRTVHAAVPAGAQSLLELGVSTRAVLDDAGVVTIATVIDCASVSGPAFTGTLEQGHGKKRARASVSAFIVGGVWHASPRGAFPDPVEDSPPFEARRATLSLTACAGPAGADECATLDTNVKLVR